MLLLQKHIEDGSTKIGHGNEAVARHTNEITGVFIGLSLHLRRKSKTTTAITPHTGANCCV